MSCTETLYIRDSTSLEEKCTRLGQIITALEIQMLEVAAGNSDVEEYRLDDGQVTIKTIYRDTVSIAKAIDRFQSLQNKCLNQLNGRVMVARNWRGLV